MAFAGTAPAAAQRTAALPSVTTTQTAPQFDVASIRRSGTQRDATFNPPDGKAGGSGRNGGHFSATNQPLLNYIEFAYPDFHERSIIPQLPAWALRQSYDIQARAEGNPTKDQMRLMMRSLLAGRFKLVVHVETRQAPVYQMVLAKPGRLGPHLQAHRPEPPCPEAPDYDSFYATTVAGGFPTNCDDWSALKAEVPGDLRRGARNIPMNSFADDLSSWGGVDRPVVDRTGLTGTFDYVIEFMPETPPGGAPPGPGAEKPDGMGATFESALSKQLGLKLVKGTADVKSYVIDHLEAPSEN
jgi:uncharacterized protein (TIGR03435 family)